MDDLRLIQIIRGDTDMLIHLIEASGGQPEVVEKAQKQVDENNQWLSNLMCEEGATYGSEFS